MKKEEITVLFNEVKVQVLKKIEVLDVLENYEEIRDYIFNALVEIETRDTIEIKEVASSEKVEIYEFKKECFAECDKYLITVYETRFKKKEMKNVLFHEFAHILTDEAMGGCQSLSHSEEYHSFGMLLGRHYETFNETMTIPKYIGRQSKYVVRCSKCGREWYSDKMDLFILDVENGKSNRTCFCGAKGCFVLTKREMV